MNKRKRPTGESFRCVTGAHEWSKKEDANRCCNGWIPKWIPRWGEDSKWRTAVLVPETDLERLAKYETVIPEKELDSYVEPWKRNLQSDSFDFASIDLVLSFLLKGFATSRHLVDATDVDLQNGARRFIYLARTLYRERIPWDDVDQRVLNAFVDANPEDLDSPFANLASPYYWMHQTYLAWCEWRTE